MGLSFSASGDLIRVPADGRFTLADIRETFAQIRASHPSSSSLRILVEDEGSDFETDTRGMKSMVSDWAALFEGASVRIALLVMRDLHFGLGRQATVFAEDSRLQFCVFRDRSQALEWLADSESGTGV